MTLGLGLRFQNKRKILEEIRAKTAQLLQKGKMSETELEVLVLFSRERLAPASTPNLFDQALTELFKQFPCFKEEEKKERTTRLEEVERGITQVLTEGESFAALENLKTLDAQDDASLFSWIQALSPWDQSKVYDWLLTTN